LASLFFLEAGKGHRAVWKLKAFKKRYLPKNHPVGTYKYE